MNVHRRVVVAVIEKAGGTRASRRELLEMLGVIDGDGQILPVDLAPHFVESLNNGLPTDRFLHRSSEEPRPGNCTTPPGLLNLTSVGEPVKPKPVKPVKPVKPKPAKATAKPVKHRQPNAGECGTSGGRMRHSRAGTPVCDKCKAAHAATTKTYREKRAAAGLPRRDRSGEHKKKNPNLPARPETCGTLAGRSNHLRRGENLCQPCATHYTNHCHIRDQRKTVEPGEEQSA